MTNIKKLILSIELTDEEKNKLINICSEWGHYCYILQTYNKFQVMKLIKYLLTERPKSNLLLSRAVSRFNRLNALKEVDLR